jgi:hypothetical protein
MKKCHADFGAFGAGCRERFGMMLNTEGFDETI